MDKSHISKSFKQTQEYICKRLEDIDGLSSFRIDSWEREEGGGGRTNTILDGRIIEKGGVAFSKVFGPVSEQMSRQLKLEGKSFFATGVSIVLHSKAIHHPIIHMNIRYFEMDDKENAKKILTILLKDSESDKIKSQANNLLNKINQQ